MSVREYNGHDSIKPDSFSTLKIDKISQQKNAFKVENAHFSTKWYLQQ